MKKLLIVSLGVAMLTACGGNKEVSWDTQETQRKIAIENSKFNARKFKTDNTQYSALNIMGRGDSTIGKNCANGDGWASVDLVDENGQVSVKLKCSTASATIGCMTKADFETRPYATEEKQCNPDLPVPMPAIAG